MSPANRQGSGRRMTSTPARLIEYTGRMVEKAQKAVKSPIWPVDPLDRVTGSSDAEFRRRTIEGILQSYHSNYDVLAEGVQNAVDAVEDAKLTGLKAPYSI